MLKHAVLTGLEQKEEGDVPYVFPVVLTTSPIPGPTAACAGLPTMPGGPTLSSLRGMIYLATVSQGSQTTSGKSGNPGVGMETIIGLTIDKLIG